MQKLPQIFTKYGYTFKLVIRTTQKAIYAQYIGELLYAYEVIKIRVRPPRYNTLLERNEPQRGIYPSSGQWGKMGWTFRTWERALERYNKI